MMPLNKLIFCAVVFGTLAACGHVDEYERHVYDREPVYCYKSLAGTQCYREPKHSDERRLVSYFGPHPSRYEKPEPASEAILQAPEMVNYWVKDPEPVPHPMAKGELTDRPWLTEEGRAKAAATQLLRKRGASTQGTRAFLRHIDDAAPTPVTLDQSNVEATGTL